MLALTRKTHYALVALADLASTDALTVSASDLATRLLMPLPALQQILTRLKHRGLVISARGSRGGYRLGRLPENITLAEVIDAIGGQFKLTLCSGPERDHELQKCPTRAVCPIMGPMRKVHHLLEQCLEQVTVAQLASDTVPVTLRTTGGSRFSGDDERKAPD